MALWSLPKFPLSFSRRDHSWCPLSSPALSIICPNAGGGRPCDDRLLKRKMRAKNISQFLPVCARLFHFRYFFLVLVHAIWTSELRDMSSLFFWNEIPIVSISYSGLG